MPRNEEGEFELVLGNRQLLSGFFIVVILFGVFFTMGYIVGRHSAPAAVTPGGTSTTTGAPPPPATSERAADTPSGLPPGEAQVVPAEKKAEDTSETASTHPATAPAESPKPEPRAPEKKKPEPPHREPVKKEPAKKEPARKAAPPEPSPASGPQKGETYLQVAAPKRAAAEGVIAGLRAKGIHGVLAPGPDDETVRVIVGPLKDASAIGKMRADLESAGFKNAFIRKY